MKKRFQCLVLLPVIAAAWWLSGCSGNSSTGNAGASGKKHGLAFAPGNDGLSLPAGFHAIVVARNLGPARQIAVAANGDIYVGLNRMSHGGGIVALRDTDGDGRADVIRYFGNGHGNGIGIHDGWLYWATDTAVLRFRMKPGSLVPDLNAQTIARLPKQDEHRARTIAFDDSGHLYVNIGAPSNACQVEDRTKGSPGIMPCPLLALHGGIWQFSAGVPGQTQQKGGRRYATGLRNCVALTWNAQAGHLFALMMGRDQLSQLFPQYYTDSMSAELPAEEFLEIKDQGNYGWPYAYYDELRKSLMVMPEYGGNGKKEVPAGKYINPIMAFPGHWAPDGLMFYTGTAFPESYRQGAFIAFHGSWNRAPLPQAGYDIVFVPFNGNKPAGNYSVFATGFARTKVIKSPADARHRPVGLAQGPDGSLYITDDAGGSIWRIVYTGS